MPLRLIAELLEAATQARALSEPRIEPTEKRRYAELAVRWEEYAKIVLRKWPVRTTRGQSPPVPMRRGSAEQALKPRRRGRRRLAVQRLARAPGHCGLLSALPSQAPVATLPQIPARCCHSWQCASQFAALAFRLPMDGVTSNPVMWMHPAVIWTIVSVTKVVLITTGSVTGAGAVSSHPILDSNS
jgi:hypothetical protein